MEFQLEFKVNSDRLNTMEEKLGQVVRLLKDYFGVYDVRLRSIERKENGTINYSEVTRL